MSANVAEGRPINVPLVAVGAVVVIASFVATLLIGQLASRPAGPAAASATQAVVVAARDVSPRTILAAADLAVAHYTVSDVPPSSLAKTSEAVGLIAQTSLRKGQPVLANQVGKDAGSGVVAAYLPLPPGIVALTVPSGELTGVAGYVQAGDYINIQAIAIPKSGGTTANVRTIYTNVRVIRVGPASVTAGGAAANSQQTGGLTSSLTLAVSQCQAEYINWFVANAALKYTLLAYPDYQTTSPTDAICAKTSSGAITESDIRSHWPGLA
jgi:pilus assembly protein CpaB